jgi:hypothetical protein
MTDAEWLACGEPMQMLRLLHGRASERKLRLFVVACCRGIWEGLRDVRSRTAVEVAERFADGLVSAEALRTAYQAAYDAVDDCVGLHPFSEDQAIAAYLSAAANVDEIDLETDATEQDGVALHAAGYAIDKSLSESDLPHAVSQTGRWQAILLRDIFGNPFRPATFSPEWLTSTVTALARQMYESRDFSSMPILADALEDAGCDNADILAHCSEPGSHVRGCWVVDAVLGKV